MQTNVKRYFTDLYFFQTITFGPSRIQKKYLWLTACYFAFILGVFSRQVTQFPTVDLNLANLNTSVFISSVIIGVAFFPFVIRLIVKLVKNFTLVKNWDEQSIESLNAIHILCAFSWGFFIDTIIDKVPSMLAEYF